MVSSSPFLLGSVYTERATNIRLFLKVLLEYEMLPSSLLPSLSSRLLDLLSPSSSSDPTRKFNLHGMSKVPFEPVGLPFFEAPRCTLIAVRFR